MVSLSQTITYYEGLKHGKTVFYDESGEIGHIRNYSKGNIVSYTYLDKSGNPVPPIPVIGQTSKVETFYKNGQMSRKYQIKNGLFEGEYIKYYPTGALKAKNFYKDNLEDGESIEYYENGKIKSKETVALDSKNGTQYYYYPNGQLKETNEYISGILFGWTVHYTESGKIKQKVKYRDGSVVEVVNL